MNKWFSIGEVLYNVLGHTKGGGITVQGFEQDTICKNPSCLEGDGGVVMRGEYQIQLFS